MYVAIAKRQIPVNFYDEKFLQIDSTHSIYGALPRRKILANSFYSPEGLLHEAEIDNLGPGMSRQSEAAQRLTSTRARAARIRMKPRIYAVAANLSGRAARRGAVGRRRRRIGRRPTLLHPIKAVRGLDGASVADSPPGAVAWLADGGGRGH